MLGTSVSHRPPGTSDFHPHEDEDKAEAEAEARAEAGAGEADQQEEAILRKKSVFQTRSSIQLSLANITNQSAENI